MGKMAGKGESPYNIKQEGKFGWLWTAHLNCSPGGTFVKHSCMNLSKLRNIQKHALYLFWIRYCVKSSFLALYWLCSFGSRPYEEWH